MGVTVRKWVTYHGFALNIDPDPELVYKVSWCNLPGEMVGALNWFTKKDIPLQVAKMYVLDTFLSVFEYEPLEIDEEVSEDDVFQASIF